MALTQRNLRRILEPIRNKIRLIVSRAIVTVVSDDQGLQVLQLKGLPGEVLDGIERFQNYGFTSVPPIGSEAIVTFIGGSRSHGVAIAVDDRRHRKKNGQPGESAHYSDEGDYILFKRGRIIEVFSGGEVNVTAPKVKLNGATEVTIDGGAVKIKSSGEVTVDGGTVKLIGTTTIETRLFLAHTHSGVEAGAGVSGPVV